MSDKATKKSSLRSIILFILIVVGLLVGFNWQTIFREVAPPVPVIVSQGGDDSSTKLFEYSMEVWADVRNDGGNGTIALEATFDQDGKSYTKTTTRYFKSLETARMELVFDEAKMFRGEPQYSIKVFSYGK